MPANIYMGLACSALAVGCRFDFDLLRDASARDAADDRPPGDARRACPPAVTLGDSGPGASSIVANGSGFAVVETAPDNVRLIVLDAVFHELHDGVLAPGFAAQTSAIAALPDVLAVSWAGATLGLWIGDAAGVEHARPAIALGAPAPAHPALAATPDGFVIAWQDGRTGLPEIYVQPVAASGMPGAEIPLTVASNATFPAIAASGAGLFAVWIADSNGERQLVGVALDRAGSPLAAPTVLGLHATKPNLVAWRDGYALLWLEDRTISQEIRFQTFDRAGVPTSSPTDVTSHIGWVVDAKPATNGDTLAVVDAVDNDSIDGGGDIVELIDVGVGGAPISIGEPGLHGDSQRPALAPAEGGGFSIVQSELREQDVANQLYLICSN